MSVECHTHLPALCGAPTPASRPAPHPWGGRGCLSNATHTCLHYVAPQRAPTPASHPTPHPSPLKCAQCAAKYDMSPKVTGSCKASNIDDMQAEKNACSGSNPIPKNANYSLGSWGPSYGVKTCADVSNVMELTAGTGSAAISYLKCFGNPSDPSLGEKYCMDSWSKFFSSAAYDTLIAGRSFSGAQLGECCIRVAFISKKSEDHPLTPLHPPLTYARSYRYWRRRMPEGVHVQGTPDLTVQWRFLLGHSHRRYGDSGLLCCLDGRHRRRPK